MKIKDLLKNIIHQENELYNLYKLGETFATYENPSLVDHFQWLASEELRHKHTIERFLEENALERTAVIDYLDVLSLEPYFQDTRAEPKTLENLVLEALIREKHSYELYKKLSEIVEGDLRDIFQMMSQEELRHGYRLKIMYEGLTK